MLKKTKIKLLVVTCIAFVLAIVSLEFSFISNAEGDNTWSFSNVEFEKTYVLGTQIEIPNCSFTVNGEESDASFQIIFPNGYCYGDDTITLNQVGNYQVVYTGNYKNVKRTVSYYFSVLHPLYSVVGANDSPTPYYGENDFNGNSYFGQKGVFTRLKNMDTFSVSQTLDISKNTKNDTILKFFNIPKTLGENDANLLITLTDVEDENNFIEIECKTVLDSTNILTHYNTYVTARFNDSDVIGASVRPAQAKDGSYLLYDGQYYSVNVNNVWGHETVFSWIGTPNGKALGEEFLTISYDYNEKIVYANGGVVVDLDDDVFYAKGFNGFSSGKVKLTIQGKKYAKSYIDLFISQIADLDLSENVFYDVDKPTIVIDYEGNDNKIPYAIKDRAYKVFDATAFDSVDGVVDVTTKVYKNINSTNKSNVPIVDGCFVPNSLGDYAIEYTAKDLSGNTNTKIVIVKVKQIREQELSANIIDKATTGNVGEEIVCYSNISVYGNNGYVNTTTEAIHKGTNTKFDIIDGKFVPLLIGEYDVNIILEDFLDSKNLSFTINILGDSNGVIKFLETPLLERYYIKNTTYKIPDFFATKMTSSKTEKIFADVFVSEDGQSFQKLSNNTLKVNASGTIQFKFGVEDEFYISDCIPVVDINYGTQNVLNVENLFIGENIVKNASNDGVLVSVDNTNEDANFDFVNSLQVKNFYLNFSLFNQKNNFNKIVFKFIDVCDRNNFIKVAYFVENGQTYYQINNSNKIKLKNNLATQDVNYTLTLNNTNLKINDELIDAYFNSNKFTGFTNDLCYLTIDFIGVTGDSSVCLGKINEQVLKNGIKDTSAPQIFVDTSDEEIEYNSIVSLREAMAKDVIDNNITFTVSVYLPNGQFATSIDGKILNNIEYNKDLKIQLSFYGEYTFIYSSIDTNSNGESKLLHKKSYTIKSKDSVSPTIELLNKPTSVEVGKSVVIGEVKVSDNTSEDVTVKAYLIDSNGICSLINDNAFVASKAGTYTVMVIATDINGNCSFETFDVVAK